jgi:hypothetical protein
VDFLKEIFGDDRLLDPSQKAMVDYLAKKYAQYEGGEYLAKRLMPSEGDKLDLENKRLDVRMKQHALGFDSSKEFDESRNSHAPLYAMALGGALQVIPEPQFLRPKKGRASLSGNPILESLTHVHGSSAGAIAGAKDAGSSRSFLKSVLGVVRRGR